MLDDEGQGSVPSPNTLFGWRKAYLPQDVHIKTKLLRTTIFLLQDMKAEIKQAGLTRRKVLCQAHSLTRWINRPLRAESSIMSKFVLTVAFQGSQHSRSTHPGAGSNNVYNKCPNRLQRLYFLNNLKDMSEHPQGTQVQRHSSD